MVPILTAGRAAGSSECSGENGIGPTLPPVGSPEAQMRVHVRLLGGFAVVVDGRPVPGDAWPRRSAAALVKLLALTPGRRMPREQVVDALWPDLLLDDALPRLHSAAHYARTALGSRDGVVLTQGSVALFPGAEVTVDVEEFEQAADAARDGP